MQKTNYDKAQAMFSMAYNYNLIHETKMETTKFFNTEKIEF